ncbi:hypothetical protein UR09_06110 [Candidatus Nitromaritima sp. SCGC AAA799-A02]|nr:hypothetical protein UR09_06110 [Candidatus Nitromaritima sp. SCGC AAA799-A02]KMP12162.1 hypothetical protein UZ36_01665 [Candidatus Nitromaritima sp. SCGC AAA799-C22]
MRKILIVEDNPAIRELVIETLWSPEWKIFESVNADAAINLCMEERPELVIMDVMMPGKIDGLEAVRIIKNTPLLYGCAVIMLSARGKKEDKVAAFKAGADDYIVKPFSPTELIKKVETSFADSSAC